MWGKEGTEGWDQVRGGRGRGERRRQPEREHYAAHTCCPLINPLSLTAQQSHVSSPSAARAMLSGGSALALGGLVRSTRHP